MNRLTRWFNTPYVQAPAAKEAISIATRTDEEIIEILDGNAVGTTFGRLSPQTAMTQATVWACVRILSESIAQLPISVQQRNGGQWVDIEHDALGLLAKPNEWQTQHEFISQMVSWTELQGNSYALKFQGQTGPVQRLIPLDATKVEAKQDKSWRITYEYGGEVLRPNRIMHLRNFGTDGYVGLSTIKNARDTIGLALAMEEHGGGVFTNGATLGTIITTPNRLDEKAHALMSRQWNAAHRGAKKAHSTTILGGDVRVETLGMNNNDSQWIDARKLSKSEIATIFGIPDFMLNSTDKSTTWGSGLEQLSRSFVRFTLQPRMSRIAQTLNHSLLADNEQQNTRFVFDTDQMTMGEFESRMTGYSTAIQAGVLNANEAREIEGRNPREGGEEYLKPMNMQGQNDAETSTEV